MIRVCNICDAFFDKEADDLSLVFLKEHLDKCSSEQPYTDDVNADGYNYFDD